MACDALPRAMPPDVDAALMTPSPSSTTQPHAPRTAALNALPNPGQGRPTDFVFIDHGYRIRPHGYARDCPEPSRTPPSASRPSNGSAALPVAATGLSAVPTPSTGSLRNAENPRRSRLLPRGHRLCLPLRQYLRELPQLRARALVHPVIDAQLDDIRVLRGYADNRGWNSETAATHG